jgi:hypothetical protein
MKSGLKKCTATLLMPLSMATLNAEAHITVEDDGRGANLKEVTVSATRSERKTDNVPRMPLAVAELNLLLQHAMA